MTTPAKTEDQIPGTERTVLTRRRATLRHLNRASRSARPEGTVPAMAVDLLYSETERDLAAALADLLAAAAAPADVHRAHRAARRPTTPSSGTRSRPRSASPAC